MVRKSMRRSRLLPLVALCAALVGCGGATPSATPDASPADGQPTGFPSPAASVDPVAADLEALLEALDTVHPAAYHGIARGEFVAELEGYERRLPGLTADEAVVELMRVVALLSREGRDGHQFAWPQPGNEGDALPLRVYEFDDGLFVTDAAPPHEELIGSRISAINGTPVDEVLDALEPLVPRDGPATVPTFRPAFLLRTEVLRGLGLIGDGPVPVTVEMPGGASASFDLEPIAFADYVSWAGGLGMIQLPADARVRYLTAPEPLTVEAIDPATLYIRYRAVVPPDVGEARARLDAGEVEDLVLDLRQNPGGDNTTFGPLLRLVQDFAGANPGRLVVLTDRVTFSAAANLATQIEQSTDATFIGEAMGGGLNFWDDVRWVTLDALPVPMQVGVSTRYWQFAEPDDPRLTIEPTPAFPVTAADFFAGRDPALEAALALGD